MTARGSMISISMRTNKPRKIFVDTWAWYALADAKDHDHLLAAATNADLLDKGYTFVTTNFVLHESVTLIRYKMHHATAVAFWKNIQQFSASGLVEIVRVSATQEKEAWRIFEQYSDQDFSLTDCASFAVMSELNMTEAFTGDHHFAVMGFLLVP